MKKTPVHIDRDLLSTLQVCHDFLLPQNQLLHKPCLIPGQNYFFFFWGPAGKFVQVNRWYGHGYSITCFKITNVDLIMKMDKRYLSCCYKWTILLLFFQGFLISNAQPVKTKFPETNSPAINYSNLSNWRLIHGNLIHQTVSPAH